MAVLLLLVGGWVDYCCWMAECKCRATPGTGRKMTNVIFPIKRGAASSGGFVWRYPVEDNSSGMWQLRHGRPPDVSGASATTATWPAVLHRGRPTADCSGHVEFCVLVAGASGKEAAGQLPAVDLSCRAGVRTLAKRRGRQRQN